MDATHMLVYLILGLLCCHIEGKLVDLTHYYNDNKTMLWPGYNPFQMNITQRGWIDLEDGSRAWSEHNVFTTPEHLGTHMDAPAHLSNHNNSWRLHEIPVERFIGDAVIINITERANTDRDALLLVSDLEEWEEEHGPIKDGSIVLLYSGWDQYWGNKTAYLGTDDDDTKKLHYPGFSAEACNWLVRNRVIHGIGSDTISFDAGISHLYDAHRIILSENLYGLENVMNLDKVPAAGARLYVFPMKHVGGSGSPCRIIAEFDPMNKKVHSGGTWLAEAHMQCFLGICLSYFSVWLMY